MQNNTTTDPFSNEDEINIQYSISVLFRRRKAFLITFLTIVLLVAAYTFLMKPEYEATATLRLKDDKGKGTVLDELLQANTNSVGQEIEIIKSRTNAEKVVKRLHLNLDITKEKGNPSYKILEFSTGNLQTSYKIILIGPNAYELENEEGKTIGSGKAGILLKGKTFTLLIDDLQGEPGDRLGIAAQPFNNAVRTFMGKSIAAENPKQTNIIRLSYRDTNPELARDAVNNLVQAYLEQTIAFKAEEANRTVTFLEQQLDKVKQELDIAERNLEAFKRSTGIVQLDVEAQTLIQKLSDTERMRAEITIQKKQAEFAITSLKNSILRNETYSPAVFRDDPIMAGMAAKLTDLETQKQALLTDYTSTHPAVKAVQEQIDELENKVKATYETSRINFEKQEKSVTQQLSVYEGSLRKLPAAERELAKLTRLFKVNADIYTFLLQKREETNIARASTISNIDIVDPAIAPDDPIKPRILLYLVIGLFSGVMLGVLVAFFKEYLDNTIKDADMVKRELDLPILAVIPHIPPGEVTMDKAKHASLITHYEPKSSISEAFRSLRTSIHFSGISKKQQVMMVTSSLPYEGKSTILGNLAIILSQTGMRVLLLDGDLRRPSMHKLYGHSKSPGLTELLAGDNDINTLIHNTEVPGLDFISAGTTPPNPAELLGSDKMKNMLQQFRERYDVILIDAPPVLAVTDALLLSTMVDMLFMVLELGKVPGKAATHAKELLQNAGAPIAGVVLNDKSEEGLQRYGYYGEKYYRYGYYYGYGNYHDNAPSREKVAWWKKLFSGKANK